MKIIQVITVIRKIRDNNWKVIAHTAFKMKHVKHKYRSTRKTLDSSRRLGNLELRILYNQTPSRCHELLNM